MKKKKRFFKPKPIVKWCKRCGKHRVKYHHYLCNNCWDEEHGVNQKEDKNKIIPFENDNKLSESGNDKENGKIYESISDELK